MKKLKELKISKTTKDMLFTIAGLVIFYIIVEIMISMGMVNSLIKGLLVPMCIYSIMALSLNLCTNVMGGLSLGHAGFMCIGAFSSAIFTKLFEKTIPIAGVRFFIAILVGMLVAAFFGFLIGIPVLRLQGDYLAIVTLAFGEIIKNIINSLYVGLDSNGFHFSMKDQFSLGMEADGKMIINGAMGITGTPKQSNFTIGIILIILVVIILTNFVNSRTGRAVLALKDNQIAATTIGIPVFKTKIIAFTISAAIAGLGGVLYAHNLNSLTALPKNFGYNMSIMILVYVVLGGNSFRGSIISAMILTALPELLRGLADFRMLIYSIVLIGMMIYKWSPKLQMYKETRKEIQQMKKNKKEVR